MANEARASFILELKDMASEGIKKLGQEINTIGKDLDKSKLLWAGAFGAIVTGIGLALKEFGEAELAVSALTQALENQGIKSSAVVEDLEDYASQLQAITNFSDETILSAQTQLVTFGLVGEQLKVTTKAAADLATAKGIDLVQASNLLGKAFIGETGTLARYGIAVDETIPKSERFAVVLNQITESMGGRAAAARTTFIGQMTALKHSFSDFLEVVGSIFAPVVGRAADLISSILQKFQSLSPEMRAVILAATALVTAFIGLTAVFAGIAASAGAVAAAFAVIVGTISSFGAIVLSIISVGAAVFVLRNRFEDLADIGVRTIKALAEAFMGLAESMWLLSTGRISQAFEKFKEVSAGALTELREQFTATTDILVEETAKQFDELVALVQNKRSLMDEAINPRAARDLQHEEDMARLDKETQDILEKIQQRELSRDEIIAAFDENRDLAADLKLERAQARLQAEQDYEKLSADRRVQIVQNAFTQQEVAEMASLIKRLNEAGKFNEARKVQIAALTEANMRGEMTWSAFFKASQVAEQSIAQRTSDVKSTLYQQAYFIAANAGRTGFYIAKALAISEAIMNTATGVTKALSLGPIIGPPLAGLIAGMGAAQVGIITAQAVNFAQGGLVMPTAGGTIARIGEAGSREAVIPLDDSGAQSEIREALGGGQATININAGVIVADDQSVHDFAKKIDEALYDLQKNRSSVAF